MRPIVSTLMAALCAALAPGVVISQQVAGIPSAPQSEYVVLVITDGVRWQEVFRGAERALMSKAGNVADTAALRRDFWRDTPAERRAALFPFLWGTVAKEGQLFGDSASGSTARIANTFRFSYPGYSETFTGFFDPRINSNGYPPNPNRTVFEWLNTDTALRGQVSAFATWNAFRRIINTERSGVPVYDGWDRGYVPGADDKSVLLRDLYANTVRLWPDNAFDALMHFTALQAMDKAMPRVLFLGYGETDEWAHAGRYDMYLRSAQQVDRYLAALWARWQADPRTRGKVTLLISTDHGRGHGAEWTTHGEDVEGAQFIWSAAIGPDIPARGVRDNSPTVQAQMAATVAAALGRDWQKAEPKAAPSLPIFRR